MTRRAKRTVGRGLWIAFAVIAVSGGQAPAASKRAEQPLVYVVVLDGLDGDRVDAGAAPFISSLLRGEDARATYFPQSRSVIPAETNPNHTAMMTGAFAGRSGIAANAFALYAPLSSEDECTTTGPIDFSAAPSETSGESATCPRAEMTFESMLRQRAGLRTAAIFGKPKLGRIFAGRNFRPSRRDVDYLWAPCSSGADDDEYCGDVPTNPVSGYAVDDKTVMDQVIGTIENGVSADGDSGRPDFTFVNLHQIDSAGHATTPGGAYNSAIGLADDEIERLVTTLKSRGEWQRTVLILVSDHSMDATPTKLALTDTLAGAGIPESDFLAVDNGSVDLIYLGDRTSPERFDLLARMRAAALAEPGVAEALYRKPNPADGGEANTVDAVHPDWHSAGARSGDLFVTAESGYAFSEPSSSSNPLPGNHGAAQTRDNFLAVIGGSPLVRQGTASGPSRRANPQNVDVAPTVMGLFGLGAPVDSSGVFLKSAFDRGELRRTARPARPRLRLHGRRLTIRPKEGRWDVQARAGKIWRFIARNRARPTIKLPPRFGDHPEVRARARSAAAVTSSWRRAS